MTLTASVWVHVNFIVVRPSSVRIVCPAHFLLCDRMSIWHCCLVSSISLLFPYTGLFLTIVLQNSGWALISSQMRLLSNSLPLIKVFTTNVLLGSMATGCTVAQVFLDMSVLPRYFRLLVMLVGLLSWYLERWERWLTLSFNVGVVK